MGVKLIVRLSQESHTSSGFAYSFEQERVLVGRSAASDVRIPHASVSLEHAIFRRQGARWVIEDKASTNGTFVRGSRIPPGRPKVIEAGEEVRLGDFVVYFHPGVAVPSTTSADRTAELARQMLRDLDLGGGGVGGVPNAKLEVLNGPDAGKVLELQRSLGRVVIGRGESCAFALTDADASREHAEIQLDEEGALLRDLGSKNGTLVNDRNVSERRLKHRDELVIGNTVLVFDDPADAALEANLGEADTVSRGPKIAPDARNSAPSGDSGATNAPAPAGSASEDIAHRPDDDASVEVAAARASNAPPARARRSPAVKVDWIVYGLAAAVFVLSIVGLVLLLGARG
ncbi:MAG: FHA domain-containing protein [Polyangiales bacterium]|nr:FHA domain-containing protein [Myxococcales bacterium]